jgi:NADPH-dependent 2,4-dienoyl-CoA reductase/sulfur reductase-like enzyme/nitrite reductase/ring-hydroxylating ferredoxin subunit
MAPDSGKAAARDLTQGVPLDELPDGGTFAGHAQGEPAVLVRQGGEVFAIGALCTHYSGPLAEGLVVGDTIRCPWHHACFSLRSGKALRAPALNPVACWRVSRRDGAVFVHEKIDLPKPPRLSSPDMPNTVIIVGGGAAGNAAAETLRNEGFGGRVILLSADQSGPYDRPNLSKAYLAGSAEEDWIPLRSPDFYKEHDIDLRLNAVVTAIDASRRTLRLADGTELAFDALLLATGAEPVRLDLPGQNLPHVHYLRTLADSRAIAAKAQIARRAVVLGASFIGLEVAASLRARNVEVEVVAPEKVPMERVLGPEAGQFLRALHEGHGVGFHLGTTAQSIGPQSVTLNGRQELEADLVVIGAGVRPAVGLAERAGLSTDRGVAVNAYLETSAPKIFAAGDIARWPDRHSSEAIRIEHFVVAERQGQTAARNILGARERFDAVPFFWTEQYDVALAYVGHAAQWDEAKTDGSFEARDCMISYCRGGKTLAVATIGRDLASLNAEVEFERAIASA